MLPFLLPCISVWEKRSAEVIKVKINEVHYHSMSLLWWHHGIDRHILQIFTSSSFLDILCTLGTDLVGDSLKLGYSPPLATIGSNRSDVVWFLSLVDNNIFISQTQTLLGIWHPTQDVTRPPPTTKGFPLTFWGWGIVLCSPLLWPSGLRDSSSFFRSGPVRHQGLGKGALLTSYLYISYCCLLSTPFVPDQPPIVVTIGSHRTVAVVVMANDVLQQLWWRPSRVTQSSHGMGAKKKRRVQYIVCIDCSRKFDKFLCYLLLVVGWHAVLAAGLKCKIQWSLNEFPNIQKKSLV